MSRFYFRLSRVLLAALFLISVNQSSNAQTTLVAGDIAFTGYHATPNSPAPDAFSFVLLTNVTANTVIRFTENAWGNNGVFRAGENTVSLTFAAAQNAGTEITIAGPPAGAATATLALGGSAGTVTGPMLSLSVNGDQVIAYQSAVEAVAPFTFVSAIHMNVYNGGVDPSVTDATNWDNLAAASQTANSSFKPTGLTTGTNAIWIGTQGNTASERNNARFNCALATGGGANLSTAAGVRAACNNQAFWDTEFAATGATPTWPLPSGCSFIAAPPSPSFTLHPVNTTVCEGANTSFTVTASNALSYQWQVDNGGGFANITNNATYAGATTTTLTITAAPTSLNGYLYRAVATNGSGSTNSNNATLTVTPLPVNPTLLLKTPATVSVADGTNVSATFNAGSGGSGGCVDDFRYTTNGGGSYLPYTPGTNISTTGLAAGSGFVFIEGRRAGCATCSGGYVVLAAWYVTPLPAAATTLNAGDIAFSGYTSTTAGDDFSFVLLRNIGAGTVINFTNNGWLSTNVFRSGEESVTWTSNAAYPAGTEIMISGLTSVLAAGGSAGTVTGTQLGLSVNGDQILAYRGTVASPTFIAAIHMNVYTVANGDPVTTTAAAWDGTANTINASALPTGLTTGINAIWIGTQGDINTEFDNARYGNCSFAGTYGPTNTLRAALNDQNNWIRNNLTPPGFTLPTGCLYFGLGAVPTINTNPSPSVVCEGANTSFTASFNGAITYQWQVDNGGGYANLSNNLTYSGVTTTTLNINATPLSLNGYLYRLVATNVSGSTPSAGALLTVNAVPVSPSIATKTPASLTVADGTNVSATFNAGSGGTGCTDDFRYTVDGGTTYLPYTPGSNISTTGLAAGSGFVFIEGRRAACASSCQGAYTVLAAWRVTPLPAAATTLNAGDIAFSGYTSTTTDDFSFVLLRNIGPGTVINFTNNGWLSTNVFRSGEESVTWTSNAAYPGGTEIKISGLTATLVGGGSAGTVTGTALGLSINGDQILAYRGTVASPTFIAAIHMNVYSTANGDPVTTTAAAWDGTANTVNASALPTGLTTGVNAIWIGTQGDINSEKNNAKYGNCTSPALNGSLVALRSALNNQANWQTDDSTPPSFTLPTGCNYLNVLCPTITVTNPGVTTGTAGTAFSQSFSASGGLAPYTFTTSSTLPTGLTLSSAGVLSGTPTQAGTFPINVVATDAGGCIGNSPVYNLVIGCPAPVLGTATPSSQTICSGATITTIVLAGAPAGAVYNWTRDNTGSVTGIAASGSGDISGALTNTTTAPVTVTFTIIPVTFGTCNQTSYTATVVVNPTPDALATPSSQSICSGATITTIVLTGSVGSTTFNWTRDNTVDATGIAASGSGDISGALTNTTNAPVTVTFTITPTANSCPGTPITATVVVNPIPNAVATPASQSRCSGQAITPIIMSGAVGGTTFNWVRDQVGVVGGSIPANGTGNISGNFTNNTGSPVTVTFTITPTANSCPGTAITATVTVNPLPTASITGGGNVAVCEDSNPVLTAGFDPNYTYAWGRSLFVAPFTAMGTAQTQPITASGSYLLTVTNQYGCTDTAMTIAHIADYVFNGTLGAGDAIQVGRLNRFAVVSTCASPKACPGLFTTVGNRFYDSYTITNNRNVPACATIGLTSFCGTNVMTALYSGSYNPASQCTNYLADPGSSPTTSIFYEATIPANSTVVLVINEVNTGTGCTGYRLTVDVPRDAADITVSPTPPFCSGTPVTLTAPAANSYVWSPGAATTQAINVTPPLGSTTYTVALTYGNYGCNASVQEIITVDPTPNVNTVANQYFCANSAAGPIALTGSVPGTVYNWTNTNTAIGLAASGTGDIPAFTATNATAAPITGTIVVTPVNGSCTGSTMTFTITVSPVPSIISVTNDDVCAPGGVVNLAATGAGIINWYTALTGGNLVNSGTTYNPNISATTTYYVESVVPSGPVSLLPMPAQSNTFPGNVRGYWFTAPTDFVITSLSVPTTASSGAQSIAVVKFNGNTPPPVFSATTNAFTTVFLTRNNPAAGSIACSIPVLAGEVIGILGYRGNVNSYAPGDYNTSIAGFPVQLQRLGMQFQLTNTDPRDLWREFGPSTSISRVEFEYSPGPACSSTPRIPVTGTVNPLPVVTATPSSQTVCSGPITTIVLTSDIPGTTFAWTRDNTVNVTGIAASGTGNISGTLTNNTFVPQTVTFTITSISPDGCAGIPVTATVDVQAVPTITCPANITVSNDLNQCGAIVTYSPTITGIPVPTVTYTFSGATTASGAGDGSGSFFNIGTTTVVITATNACGTANCTFTVTVNDTQFPTITCPAPLTVDCPGDIPAPSPGTVVAADNCPGVVVTHISDVISNITCPNRYTITRTYRATDASGNGTNCTQVITVNDVTAPTLTCPAPVTVSCAADVPAVNIATVTGVTDNCGSLGGPVTVTHISDVITNQTCANRYTITRTYRATDVCGNFAECTQIITVNDQTAPTLTCPGPVTVSCAAAVPAANIASVTGVSDNCAGVVTVTHISDVITNQTCANRYTITRTYRATDVCGNFTECTQIITVNDQTAPTLTCPGPVTVSCAAAVPAANIASVTGVSDNCAGVVTVTHVGDVISSQTCANRFTITRTYRATDVCGNFTECTQIITVNDQTPPTLTCPGPVTVSCASAVPAPSIASVTGVSDNCAGVVTVTHQGDVISNQTCANRYTITRTYRATDVCGNFTECTQIITVNDVTPPTLTCPGPVTVSCASAVPAPNIASVTGVSDNCGGVITVTHQGDVITNQTCANRYTITRTYRATDVCGNFTQCTQTITVNDVTAPVITCPAAVTVSCASAVPAVNTASVTATDNCGGVITITHISDVITNQTCPNRFTLTRTYRATDVCGNFSQCTQVITVNDQTAPVITCPANMTVTTPVGSCTAVVNYNVTATDNCGAVTVVTVPASGSTFPIGTTTVTSTATDACGMTSVCSFTVTVIDAQLAQITAQPVNRTVCFGTNATFSVTAVTTPTAGGPIAYQWQTFNGTTWVDIPGANASTYTLNNVTHSLNATSYRVRVTGLCSFVISNHATLYVNALPTVSITLSNPPIVNPVHTVTITATASPGGGTYVWLKNNVIIPGASGPTLGPLGVFDVGFYKVIYTDPNGCVQTSNEVEVRATPSVEMWVYPVPNAGIFHVRFYNQPNEQMTVQVISSVGQLVFRKAVQTTLPYTDILINLGENSRLIMPGVYTVELLGSNGQRVGTKQIIVTNPN